MDKLFIIPHTHYDAEVFLTREEYLEVGYKVIIDALNVLKSDPDYRNCWNRSLQHSGTVDIIEIECRR